MALITEKRFFSKLVNKKKKNGRRNLILMTVTWDTRKESYVSFVPEPTTVVCLSYADIRQFYHELKNAMKKPAFVFEEFPREIPMKRPYNKTENFEATAALKKYRRAGMTDEDLKKEGII